MKNRTAVRWGRLGGMVTSERKTEACRKNAKLGGRPRKYLGVCPLYTYHKFTSDPMRCPCGYRREDA